jgi:integrase
MCGRKAGWCPDRIRINTDTAETKSAAGRRIVGLPTELVVMLKEHREEQDRERHHAGSLWREGGWVFATPTGTPINSITDYQAWKALLRRAGVRDARLHDARHTAATVLLVLGVPERTVMSVMGWSSTSMAARYQHVIDPIRRDVARRVGVLLWATKEDGAESSETRTETTASNRGDRPGLATAASERVCPGQVAEVAGFEPARGNHPQPA